MVLGFFLCSLSFPGRADVLYVPNGGNNTIEKFMSGGGGSLFVNSSDPAGVAFDDSGNLYVSSISDNTIVKFTSL